MFLPNLILFFFSYCFHHSNLANMRKCNKILLIFKRSAAKNLLAYMRKKMKNTVTIYLGVL